MNKTPLIVTGLSGLIGQRFKQRYQDSYTFENLDLSVGIDITDGAAINQAVGQSTADSIIHLAAFTNVAKAFEQTGDTSGSCYQVNVIGTQNIVNAAKNHDKFLIHISTDFVFDGTKKDPYTEEDKPNPIEWYGQTKYQAEQIVQAKLDNALILRLAYPYQRNPSRPDLIQKIRDRLSETDFTAFTDHVITPTFADDLCAVFHYATQNKPSGLYHATGSSWHSDYEIAQLVKQNFNLPGKIKKGTLEEYQKTTERPYQRTLKISNQKLQKDFEIQLTTLPQGLKQLKT